MAKNGYSQPQVYHDDHVRVKSFAEGLEMPIADVYHIMVTLSKDHLSELMKLKSLSKNGEKK